MMKVLSVFEPGPLGSCPGTTFSRYLGFVWPAWCSYRLPCVADPVTGETDPRIFVPPGTGLSGGGRRLVAKDYRGSSGGCSD